MGKVALVILSLLLCGLLVGAVSAATASFTSSDTWEVPAGVSSIDVIVVGGGAGGGGGGGGNPMGVPYYTASRGGGGGGGSGYKTEQNSVSVTPGQTLTITVGSGGSGGSGGAKGYNGVDGNDGGQSSITGTGVSVTANGGVKGLTGSAAAGGTGGAGGNAGSTGTGGCLSCTDNSPGGNGGAAIYSTYGAGGNGGYGGCNAVGEAGSTGGAGYIQITYIIIPTTLSPHIKYTTFPTPPAGYSVTTYPAEGVTCSKATLKCNIESESEVWFEYGFTSGQYSYSTEHTSCSAGNQTETINGIPLTAGKTVYYRAVTPYGYGEEMNFTTLELGATAFPTSTYSIYVTQFFETEGNFTAMAELIWAPYIAKFGTLFFSILIGVIFLGLAAKQGSSFIPLLVIFIIGIPIFVMLAPEFLWLAQALIILGVGIAIYYFLTQPR